MPYDKSNNIVDNLANSDNLLDILIGMDDFFDDLDLYAFKGWINGEIIEGPIIKRYWVLITLKYGYEDMPDPTGAARLTKYGVKIEYEKAKEKVDVEVETPDDLDPETKKPKTTEEDIWLVHVRVPRRYITELEIEDLDLWDEDETDIDKDAVEDASDDGIDDRTGITDEDDPMSDVGGMEDTGSDMDDMGDDDFKF